MPIPYSDIVTVNPGVVSPGGSTLALNMLLLSQSARLPTKTAVPFTSVAAVTSTFGAGSNEEAMATVYFKGFDNSSIKPSLLYFYAFAPVARGGWLRSGSFPGVQLANIQALGAGTLTINIDGAPFTSASINLALATSLTNAATLITAGFSGTGAPVVTWEASSANFLVSSTTTGSTSTVSFATGALSTGLKLTAATGAYASAGVSADTASAVMDAIKIQTQNWATFSTVWEPGIVDKKAFAAWASSQNSRFLYIPWDSDPKAITSLDIVPAGMTYGAGGFGTVCGTGNGATTVPVVTGGNFTVSVACATASTTAVTKTLVSQVGAFEVGIVPTTSYAYAKYGSGPTQVTLSTTFNVAIAPTNVVLELNVSDTGATLLANGAVIASSATGGTAAGVVASNPLRVRHLAPSVQDWIGNIWELAIFNYARHTGAYTVETAPFTGLENGLVALYHLAGDANNYTSAFGPAAVAQAYDGVMMVYPDRNSAALSGGIAASINFRQRNGRTIAKFRSQAGLPAQITDKPTADTLLAGYYNFYGSYGGNAATSNFFADGRLVGKWKWFDLFINQINLNAQLQSVLISLLTQSPSISYTPAGYSIIRTALTGPIEDAREFGSIRRGVVLDSTQTAAINQAAGLDAATVIQNEGYYLQILDPGATVRGQRGSPVINLWYADGGAVQQITLASIDVI